MTYAEWQEAGRAFGAPIVALVVGLVAGLVAWQQWRVARAKLKLDLFEHRYALYEEIWDHLSRATEDSPDIDQLRKFNNLIPKAHFLFGPAIGEYCELARSNAIKLRQRHRQLAALQPQDPRRGSAEKEVIDLSGWFDAELNGLRSRFSTYMDFEEWR